METREQQAARHREVVDTYYQTHDERPLNRLLAELRPGMLGYVRGKLGIRDADRAEDLVQDAQLQLLLWLRKKGFRGELGTLTAATRTLCLRALTRQLRGASGHNEQLLHFSHHDEPCLGQVAEEQVDSEQVAAASTVVATVTTAVLALPPRLGQLLATRYYKGLSPEEAARHLALPLPSYRTLQTRALKQTRERLAAQAPPSPEVYAALPYLDSGDLFTEPLRLAS